MHVVVVHVYTTCTTCIPHVQRHVNPESVAITSGGYYSSAACVHGRATKIRLLFKGGFYSKAAFIQDFTIIRSGDILLPSLTC